MQVVIDQQGDVTMIVNDLIEPTEFGPARQWRASHVLPVNRFLRRWFCRLRRWFGERGLVAAFTRRWPCQWLVDLGPSGGSVFGPFRRRDAAIRFEIDWLERNRL